MTLPASMSLVKLAFLAVAALFVFQYLLNPATFTLLDYANLIFHEAGHVLFTPLGEFMHFLGGSVF
jgi:hypothetical protein